jgi:hypothetical protein
MFHQIEKNGQFNLLMLHQKWTSILSIEIES